MLTVIREMAEEAERPEVTALSFADALRLVVARGDGAVARTPELLDTLRDAGVVDAGGVGVVELARGVLHELTGEADEVPDVVDELTEESIHQEVSVRRPARRSSSRGTTSTSAGSARRSRASATRCW